MNCPPEIAAILLRIIHRAILQIRQLGWADNPARCAIEADHIHNLPDLLLTYSPDRLKFYWEVERPSFIGQSSPADTGRFEELWNELGRHAAGSRGGAQRPA